MNISDLYQDTKAVSPAIAAVLLLAITIITATAVGTAMMSIQQELAQDSPDVSFAFSYENNPSMATDDWGTPIGPNEGVVTMTHTGGPPLDATQVTVIGSSVTPSAPMAKSGTTTPFNLGEEIHVSSEATIGVKRDDTIRIVWRADNGDLTATLGEWTGPAA